jgi:hypothetical protein
MGYRTDHGFRKDLWTQVTSGLPAPIVREAHEHLGKYYREEKNTMTYDQLLDVVREVMSNHPGWSWNGQRWYQ